MTATSSTHGRWRAPGPCLSRGGGGPGRRAPGRLEGVLPEWDGGEAPVIALYPSAQHMPLKTRALLDELAAHVAAMMNPARTRASATRKARLRPGTRA